MSMRNRTWFRYSEMTFPDEREPDRLWSCSLMDGGRITVLDRMTGYGCGIRDTETGYRASCGRWFLASGDYDIRRHLDQFNSEDEMAEWVMQRANNCAGDDNRKLYIVPQPECFA